MCQSVRSDRTDPQSVQCEIVSFCLGSKGMIHTHQAFKLPIQNIESAKKKVNHDHTVHTAVGYNHSEEMTRLPCAGTRDSLAPTRG
jgi:hypothetical protein